MSVTTNTTLRRPPTTRLRRFRGKILVAVGENGFELDEVAAAAMQQVDGRRSIADIAYALSGTFDVESAVVAKDLIDFFETMVDEGVVVISDPEGPRAS